MESKDLSVYKGVIQAAYGIGMQLFGDGYSEVRNAIRLQRTFPVFYILAIFRQIASLY